MDEFTIESEQGTLRDVAPFCALRTIKSNTGCGSPGEADIALSTSIVAD
jgi:hypothetical protein